MKLTREEALKYHRQMWTDMQKELGNKPNVGERVLFKENWCDEHFPDEYIESNCFLCEYNRNVDDDRCKYCLIVWPYGKCINHQYYYNIPISEILALPERKVIE